MFLRIRIPYAVLLNGTALDSRVCAILGMNTFWQFITLLKIKVVAARLVTCTVETSAWAGSGGAELEHTAKQRTKSGHASNYHTDAVLGITPNHNVAKSMEVVVAAVEVDSVFETDAGGKRGQNTERKKEDD